MAATASPFSTKRRDILTLRSHTVSIPSSQLLAVYGCAFSITLTEALLGGNKVRGGSVGARLEQEV